MQISAKIWQKKQKTFSPTLNYVKEHVLETFTSELIVN